MGRQLSKSTQYALAAFIGGLMLLIASQNALARTENTQKAEPQKSILGSFLAARFAQAKYDMKSAVALYRRARSDKKASAKLIERSFQVEAIEGNTIEARALAERLISLIKTETPRLTIELTALRKSIAEKTPRADVQDEELTALQKRARTIEEKLSSLKQKGHLARIWLGASEFHRGRFASANNYFDKSVGNPISELTGLLARAWLKQAMGDTKGALQVLDNSHQIEWARFYVRYHKALIAELANDHKVAQANYASIFRLDSSTPRFALAYATHSARIGEFGLARTIIARHTLRRGGTPHPTIRALSTKLDANIPLTRVVKNAAQGMSEAFYGLGEALAAEGGISIGAIYLRLSLMIDNSSLFARTRLANIYERMRRFDRAIEAYDEIPRGTPWDTAVQIRKAVNLGRLKKTEHAKRILEEIADRNPKDFRPLDALGELMHRQKNYAEAAKYYSRIISLVANPKRQHWRYWYSRGISFERMKRWPPAERDLKKALELYPNQPQVLNYLGYSWIDQKLNLKRALRMIEKAVALKPDDGYFMDSLGWAHYRLRNFKKAVKYLERAVELRPEDPILNDHLGDALWRNGRRREAIYQWELALTLKPTPADKAKIKKKLRDGLPKPVIKKHRIGPKRRQNTSKNKRALKKVEKTTDFLPPLR